jgi:hypothetical protein
VLRLAYLAMTNTFALIRMLPVSDRDKDVEILALCRTVAGRCCDDQVEACAGRALGRDGIGLQDEHVQQADRQGHAHAAQQEAHNIGRDRALSISSTAYADIVRDPC